MEKRRERKKKKRRDDEIRTSSRIFLPLPPIKWEQRIEDAPGEVIGGLTKSPFPSVGDP